MKRLLLFCLLLTTLSSCAHIISAENRENALSTVSLGEVRAHADQYAGKTFIFGGVIAHTAATEMGSELEVIQMPLDEWGYVAAHDQSEGRFIVTARSHLDPLIFRKGREVTISGVLMGTRTEKLGENDYHFPLFKAKEIHLLPRKVYYPASYYGYEPLYYPYYWGGPFFLQPSLYFHMH
ncbi:MAG: Slp family lipoprotein [Nitrospirae bacterium]|nr:Slp family lipoprotein [Nitrospirota bacterium]